MAAAATRFLLSHISILSNSEDSIRLYPVKRIPLNDDGYYVDFDGNEVKLHTSSCKCDICNGKSRSKLFSSDNETCTAQSFGLSVLALVSFNCAGYDDQCDRFIIIKRSEKLSTFPGKLALPGGFYESNDKTLQNTALRELKEETGSEWLENTNLQYRGCCAIIDSIPTSSRHNVTIIEHFNVEEWNDPSKLRSNVRLQDDEVDDVFFWSLYDIQDHINEFTPGLQRFFNHFNYQQSYDSDYRGSPFSVRIDSNFFDRGF